MRPRSNREGYEDACSAELAIASSDGSAVCADNGIDEGKAEPMAIRRSSSHPVFEQSRQYFRIESRPVIFKDERCAVLAGL